MEAETNHRQPDATRRQLWNYCGQNRSRVLSPTVGSSPISSTSCPHNTPVKAVIVSCERVLPSWHNGVDIHTEGLQESWKLKRTTVSRTRRAVRLWTWRPPRCRTIVWRPPRCRTIVVKHSPTVSPTIVYKILILNV